MAHDLVDEQSRARAQAFDGVVELALDPRAHAREQQPGAPEQLVELARRVRLVHPAKVSGAT